MGNTLVKNEHLNILFSMISITNQNKPCTWMPPILIQEFGGEDVQETGKNPGHLRSAASHKEPHYPHQNWSRDYHNQQQQHPHSPKDSDHYVI